jgi:hypothetical protein
MSFGIRAWVFAVGLGQLLAGCAEDTPDHLDFTLRTLSFVVESRISPPPGGIPNMVCAGPQALATDCCNPPPPSPPIDCQQYPIVCDEVEHFCALSYDSESTAETNLLADVPAVAAVDGRAFASVSLVAVYATVTSKGNLPVRSASLYLGPKGLASAASPEATLFATLLLSPGTTVLTPPAEAQQAFSRLARDYRTPFSWLLSAHLVVAPGITPSGSVTLTVAATAEARY